MIGRESAADDGTGKGGRRRLSTLERALLALVLVRLLLYALALPPFEGPDEPFHLGRARSVAAAPWAGLVEGRPLDRRLVAEVASRPCAPDLQRAFGCPAFGDGSAWFGALAPPPDGAAPAAAGAPVRNYQDHQPPLWPALAGGLLRLLPGVERPARELLLLRLLNALTVAAGAHLVARRLLDRAPATLLLAALLLPGSAEALARVANDAAVFAWAAVFLVVLRAGEPGGGERSPAPRIALLAVLAAAGPLLKLTAVPVVAFAAADRLRHRPRGEALAVALGGALVLPLQWLRGWAWGGTLEMQELGPIASWSEAAVGVLHSAATAAKTALWLGGWSGFRPPAWVLLAAAGLAVWGTTLARPRRGGAAWPHLAGLLVAAAGFVAFAIGKHRLFGVWGAVGGWYLWSWAPWLALAAQEGVRFPFRRPAGRAWAAAAVAFLLAVDLAWLAAADRVYGGGRASPAARALHRVGEGEEPGDLQALLRRHQERWARATVTAARRPPPAAAPRARPA